MSLFTFLLKWLPAAPQRNPELLNRLGKPFKASFCLQLHLSPFHPLLPHRLLRSSRCPELSVPQTSGLFLTSEPLNCSSRCLKGSSHPFTRPTPDSSFCCQLTRSFLWLFWLCFQSSLCLVLTLPDAHFPLDYCKRLKDSGSLALQPKHLDNEWGVTAQQGYSE